MTAIPASCCAACSRRWRKPPTGAPDDVTGFFRAIGRASAGATGSSLGTLLTTAFLTIAKAGEGKGEIAWSDLGAQLGAARDAMMARGRASLGDKTVLDALDAVAQAIAGLDDPEAIKRAALEAARGTLDAFRDRPCKIGRARMFAEKSIGMDDPGMLRLRPPGRDALRYAVKSSLSLPNGPTSASTTSPGLAYSRPV